MSIWKEEEQGWTCIKTVVDSGAADSVAPTDMAPDIRVEESPGSKRGQAYMSASGGTSTTPWGVVWIERKRKYGKRSQF